MKEAKTASKPKSVKNAPRTRPASPTKKLARDTAKKVPLRSQPADRGGYQLCRISGTGTVIPVTKIGTSVHPFEIVAQYPDKNMVALKKYIKTAHGVEPKLFLIDPDTGYMPSDLAQGTRIILYDDKNDDFYYPTLTPNVLPAAQLPQILMILMAYEHMLRQNGVILDGNGNITDDIAATRTNSYQITCDTIGIPLLVIPMPMEQIRDMARTPIIRPRRRNVAHIKSMPQSHTTTRITPHLTTPYKLREKTARQLITQKRAAAIRRNTRAHSTAQSNNTHTR